MPSHSSSQSSGSNDSEPTPQPFSEHTTSPANDRPPGDGESVSASSPLPVPNRYRDTDRYSDTACETPVIPAAIVVSLRESGEPPSAFIREGEPSLPSATPILAERESPHILAAEQVSEFSWPFRFGKWLAGSCEKLLGVATLILLLSFISAIPLLQLLTLGYLMECTRRIVLTGRFWSGAVGVRKAARIGAWLLGTALCLLPIQYLSTIWYASFLVDPSSDTTRLLRTLQIVATALLVPHIIAAWYCGGRLRHFFWPIVAPFSLALWLTRKSANSPSLRPILNRTLGLVSPRLVEDLCRAQPLTDWFLPAILLKGLWTGTLFTKARDGLWDFTIGLRLPHYFWFGARAYVGTIAWLFLPTMLLIGISVLPSALSVLSGALGVLGMAFVLLYVPFAQAHFAAENQLVALFDLGGIRRAFRGAPILHAISLFLLLAFSLPLFLLKIEFIPPELLWLPALAFMLLMWPARALIAWAYSRGIRRSSRRFFLTWPLRSVQLASTLAYTFFVLLSQYIAWNGSLSMLEQHIVLVPAPFTRLPFLG